MITTTNPSIVRVVIDYSWKALKGKGKIIVADAPSSETDFDTLIEKTGYKEMIDELNNRGINVSLCDYRAVKTVVDDGIWIGEQKNVSKTVKPVLVNLGKNSCFYGEKKKYHGGGYDIKLTTRHHTGKTQEYCVAGEVLGADVVISIPKLKTHRKAGVTCCLKNLVGINCDKDYLPHFAMGAANMGGDEMPEISKGHIIIMRIYNWIRENIIAYTWKYIGGISAKFLGKIRKRKTLRKSSKNNQNFIAEKDNLESSYSSENKSTETNASWLHTKLSGQSISSGAWQGNETITKMIIDLNRIFMYCDRDGVLHDNLQRKIFYVVDGVYGGMGNGPIAATPVHTGVIACGYNGALVDTSILKSFNIDPSVIPLYKRAYNNDWLWNGSDGDVVFNGKDLSEAKCDEKLKAPDNWNFIKQKIISE